VNRALGMGAGDAVLLAVADAVMGSVRGTDVAARWTSDEFVIVGPGTGVSPLEFERRVRNRIATNPPVSTDTWDGRVSIGSATLVPWDEGDLVSLLNRAEQDMTLRRSLRRQGRDRASALGPMARRLVEDDPAPGSNSDSGSRSGSGSGPDSGSGKGTAADATRDAEPEGYIAPMSKDRSDEDPNR